MDGNKFRDVVRSGTESYGSERWYFLRELAQNSRDADARSIRVLSGYLDEHTEYIRFEDDGIGMSKNHAEAYLFKLYASSKEDQKNTIGKYGIGFWTVLNFDPYAIIIESHHHHKSWAVQLNSKLEFESIPPTIKRQGTKLTFLRYSKYDSPTHYIRTVGDELKRYCKYLTLKKNNSEQLPVLFNGKIINEQMSIPGPDTLSKTFRHKNLNGVVAFGEKPKVMLYSKGLPVWQGAVLTDLTDRASVSRQTQFETGSGLAPVYLLNSSDIDINFSRNSPIDNQGLEKMIHQAENQLAALVFSFIRNTTPLSLPMLAKEGVGRLKRLFGRSYFMKLALIVLLLIPLEILLLNILFPKQENNVRRETVLAPPSLSVDENRYTGASVNPDLDLVQDKSFSITYQPPTNRLFRLYSAGHYDLKQGFIYRVSPARKQSPIGEKRNGIDIRIENVTEGKLFLPLVLGYGIDVRSIRLNGSTVSNPDLTYFGDQSVQFYLKNSMQRIEYKLYPLADSSGIIDTAQSTHLSTPENLALPESLRQLLQGLKDESNSSRIHQLANTVRRFVRYSRSTQVAQRYRRETELNWHNKVLNIGAGDCDVINGLYALLLRELGTPARLAIGFIGQKGKLLPNLHAWTEYYDSSSREWRVVDVSSFPSNPNLNPGSEVGDRRDSEGSVAERIVVTPGSGSTSTFLDQRFLTLVLSIFTVLFLFLSILLFWKKKSFKIKNGKIAESLGNIAMNAVIYPDIWKSNNHIWKNKYIPLMGKRFISLERIMNKVQQNHIFKGSRENSLINRHNIMKMDILDASNRFYAGLIKIIPNITDLDKIEKMKITPVTSIDFGAPEINALLYRAERYLRNASKGKLRFFVYSAFEGEGFQDIRLSRHIAPYVERFVLINTNHADFQKIHRIKGDIRRKIHHLIERVLDTFEMMPRERLLIQNRISRMLFRMKDE